MITDVVSKYIGKETDIEVAAPVGKGTIKRSQKQSFRGGVAAANLPKRWRLVKQSNQRM